MNFYDNHEPQLKVLLLVLGLIAIVVGTVERNRLRVLDAWTRNGLRLRVVRLHGVTWAEMWLGSPTWPLILKDGKSYDAGWTAVPSQWGPGALGANRWADAMYEYDQRQRVRVIEGVK